MNNFNGPQGGNDVWQKIADYLNSSRGRAAFGGASDALLAQGGWSTMPSGGVAQNIATALQGSRQGVAKHDAQVASQQGDPWDKVKQGMEYLDWQQEQRMMRARNRLSSMAKSDPMYKQTLMEAYPEIAGKSMVSDAFDRPASPTTKQGINPATGQPGFWYQQNGQTHWLNNVAPMPRDSLSVSLPDGTVINQGQQGNPSQLAKPTVNRLQDDVVNLQSGLDRLGQVMGSFDEEFLTYGGKLRAGAASVADKAGLSNPDQQQLLARSSTMKSDVMDNLNTYLNQMSGAAVTPQEFERLKNRMPNMNDSPAEFKSKSEAVYQQLRLALARSKYTLAQGIDYQSVSIDQMYELLNQAGAELAKAFRQQNPQANDEAIKQMVKDELRKEYGL